MLFSTSHVVSFQKHYGNPIEILNIIPDDINTLSLQAAIAQAEGDLTRSSMLLHRLRPSAADTGVILQNVYQSILERRPARLASSVREMVTTRDPTVANLPGN